MKATREMLEDRLVSCQEELKGFSSYVKELKAMTAKHGTDQTQVEDDLREAEHNIGRLFFDWFCRRRDPWLKTKIAERQIDLRQSVVVRKANC